MKYKNIQSQKEIIFFSKKLCDLKLNTGTSGNISVRQKDGFLITPTGMDYQNLRPQDIVFMNMKKSIFGKRNPSSEWPFHLEIMKKRTDINAIVHTHSTYATVLACQRKGIPRFHYMVAVAGGNDIRCAPYSTFGTSHLSKNILSALKNRKACLVANHGMVSTGKTLKEAFDLAVEVENLAKQYWKILLSGRAKLLSISQMQTVLKKFKSYGKQKIDR
ncbi:MAG: class II aldolase/adducin family protein [Pseudomonadota bacterium]|nr:class II aldolase/adducin family protein [Pseudomonadota bacterium]MED5339352.1 class II aldolase/adducin family protein [Pseudomonadota bacterium]MEE3207273.1 class II aldolase/adducin family protein [Pseudomonadota bacterium]MEE3260926.1 class II aldolase/adducin family protein [Pseudomonadota bacterium]|tara:strand:+ start:270 stop:923 length:654 start_codon:yes stop_codon:yes gene_type:complete